MSEPPAKPAPRAFSLRRWSQRKLEASARAQRDAAAAAAGAKERDVDATPLHAVASSSARGEPSPNDAALPAPETLGFDADFTGFFKPDTDDSLKRAALKQLLRDPRFNVMDGLDTYVDDYTRPDPVPDSMLSALVQRRYIVDPPLDEADDPRCDEPVALRVDEPLVPQSLEPSNDETCARQTHADGVPSEPPAS